MVKGIIAGILAIGLIIVAILLAISARNPTYAGQVPQNTISVSGSAQIMANPDQAEIYLHTHTQAATAQASKDSNAQISSRVNTALLAAGINKENIETSQYAITPKQHYNEASQSFITDGYQTDLVYKVTTTDVQNVGKYIDAGINAGATGVDYVEFTLSKPYGKQVKNQLLGLATDDADQKADTLAKSLNLAVGPVVSVSETNYVFQPYTYSQAAAPLATKVPTQVPPQTVEVSATVGVVYQIAR